VSQFAKEYQQFADDLHLALPYFWGPGHQASQQRQIVGFPVMCLCGVIESHILFLHYGVPHYPLPQTLEDGYLSLETVRNTNKTSVQDVG
jgi:hypothetical protein